MVERSEHPQLRRPLVRRDVRLLPPAAETGGPGAGRHPRTEPARGPHDARHARTQLLTSGRRPVRPPVHLEVPRDQLWVVLLEPWDVLLADARSQVEQDRRSAVASWPSPRCWSARWPARHSPCTYTSSPRSPSRCSSPRPSQLSAGGPVPPIRRGSTPLSRTDRTEQEGPARYLTRTVHTVSR